MAVRCTGLVKRYEDVVAVAGIDLEVRAGRVLRPARAQRRRQDDHGRDPRGTDRARRGRRSRCSAADGGPGATTSCASAWACSSRRRSSPRSSRSSETLRLFGSFFTRARPVDEVIAHGRARGEATGARRQALRRAEAAPGARLRAGERPRAAVPGRAHHRSRPAGAPARCGRWWRRFARAAARCCSPRTTWRRPTRLCDRVAIMDHGTDLSLGPPGALVASLGAEQIVEFDARGDLDPRALARPARGGRASRASERSFRLSVRRIGEALPALLAELERRGARAGEPHHPPGDARGRVRSPDREGAAR